MSFTATAINASETESYSKSSVKQRTTGQKVKGIVADLLYKLYAVRKNCVRKMVIRLIYKLEGGQFTSETLRRISKDYYGVEIGKYTHGGCFEFGQLQPHTRIGRYCSIAHGVIAYNRDHPADFKSTHAFFFNSKLGYCKEDLVEYVPLTIGNDVWIGHGAKILPNVTEIGDGAVIAAGAIVSKNVPPYAVVAGNPGRIVRYRFSKEVINDLLASRWWDKDVEELMSDIEEYNQPYENFLEKEEVDNIFQNNTSVQNQDQPVPILA